MTEVTGNHDDGSRATLLSDGYVLGHSISDYAWYALRELILWRIISGIQCAFIFPTSLLQIKWKGAPLDPLEFSRHVPSIFMTISLMNASFWLVCLLISAGCASGSFS